MLFIVVYSSFFWYDKDTLKFRQRLSGSAGAYRLKYRDGRNMISISLCMIVKNEEAVLARCLDSVADLVDEIIIVDTGSTDRTKEIGAGYICKAKKPSPKNYIRAMERMGTEPLTTVFVGDQLFTDIWGAKRAGIYAYLVKPLAKREEIQIVLKRKLERIVLFFYRRACRKAGKG